MKFRLETAILDNILFESQSNLNFVLSTNRENLSKSLVKSLWLFHNMHIRHPYVWSTPLQGASDCNSNGLWNAYSCLEYGECQ